MVVVLIIDGPAAHEPGMHPCLLTFRRSFPRIVVLLLRIPRILLTQCHCAASVL